MTPFKSVAIYLERQSIAAEVERGGQIADVRAHEGQMIQITGLMKKGQYGQGFPIGGGVRVIPGTGGAVGNRPTVGTETVSYIDVESWQPAPGGCPD